MYYKYASVAFLPIFLAKLILKDNNISDAMIVLALSAIYAFSYYLESKKEIPINQKVKDELSSLKEEVKEMKSTLTAFKLTHQIRTK